MCSKPQMKSGTRTDLKFWSRMRCCVYVIAWVAVQFGMNCTSNATRKEINCMRWSRVQFTFLVALRVQFIPKLHRNPCYHKLIIITLLIFSIKETLISRHNIETSIPLCSCHLVNRFAQVFVDFQCFCFYSYPSTVAIRSLQRQYRRWSWVGAGRWEGQAVVRSRTEANQQYYRTLGRNCRYLRE